ncbi:MAG: SpoIIE family protein phosphatase [Candidatus Riflebacteria bacterium]|nr:SpoIIE family protein phosphatase [Candidatus Riflebacteria bacterium]
MKILVADDDPISRLMVTEMLSEWGHDPIAVSNGTEAWSILETKESPLIAVLDWEMPGIDGNEICQRYRRLHREPQCHLILLTSKSSRTEVVIGLQSGADDYLTKPFDRNELKARIDVARRLVKLEENLSSRLRELEETVSIIHRNFLIGHVPENIPRIAIAAEIQPFFEMAGDFFDFQPNGADGFDFLIGDVMGKGIRPALLGAATINKILRESRNLALQDISRLPSISAILAPALDQIIPGFQEIDSFVTLVFGRFDLKRSSFCYVNFGHPWPIRYSAKADTCELLEGNNAPIAILNYDKPVEIEVALNPGDVFCFCSDGVTEVHDKTRNQFGIERLKDIVKGLASGTPDKMLAEIFKSARSFSRTGTFADDATCVVVKITER